MGKLSLELPVAGYWRVHPRAILAHIGEPATAPRIASARGPPEWYEDSVQGAIADDACLSGDPLAQPEPEHEYD